MKLKNLLKPDNWWILILSGVIAYMLFMIYSEPEYNKAFNFILPGLAITFLSTFISFIIALFLGLISGIVGIGGGIFLSPILFLLQAERPRVIATTASLFILINSISGVLGQFSKENVIDNLVNYWPLFFSVLLGGFIGNYLNLKIFSSRALTIMTSLLVIFVAARMGFKIFF